MIDQAHLGIASPGTYAVILDAIRPIRGLKILDIPCGSGGFADQMRTEGAVCIGADIAPPTGHQSVVTADMNKTLPFASESFDVITCIEGIEHIHDVFHLLGEYHRVLRPGGRLILSTPNLQNLRSRIKFMLRGTLFWFDHREITGVGHVNVVPCFLLKHILEKSGFTMISVRTNRRIFPYLPAWICALMQMCFSKKNQGDREQNSPVLLNGEGLIVLAHKAEGELPRVPLP